MAYAQGSRKFRAGKNGCNPACQNGGSCTRVKTGAFKCTCLLGLFGQACGKIVNYCVTLSDGVTRPTVPACSSDPLINSCAPTIGPISGTATATPPIHLAGYACFQTDQTGTCVVTAAATSPDVFTYTCTTRDNSHYVYGY